MKAYQQKFAADLTIIVTVNIVVNKTVIYRCDFSVRLLLILVDAVKLEWLQDFSSILLSALSAAALSVCI